MRIFETANAPVAANKYLLPHEHLVIILRQHPAKLLPTLTVAAGGLRRSGGVGVLSKASPRSTLSCGCLRVSWSPGSPQMS